MSPNFERRIANRDHHRAVRGSAQQNWRSGKDSNVINAIAAHDREFSSLSTPKLPGLLRAFHNMAHHTLSVPNPCAMCPFFSNISDAKLDRGEIERACGDGAKIAGGLGLLHGVEMDRPLELVASEEVGRLREASGAASAPSGGIMVADTNNGRLVMFRSNDSFPFGDISRGFFPACVAYQSNGDVVVITRRNGWDQSLLGQVQIWHRCRDDTNPRHLNRVQSSLPLFKYPRGVTVDEEDRIIVVEGKVKLLWIFNTPNSFEKFNIDFTEFPTDVANHDGTLFVCDNEKHCVHRLDYRGQQLSTIGCVGIFKYPVRVNVDSQGRLIVVDNHNRLNVSRFDAKTGTLSKVFYSTKKHTKVLAATLIDDKRIFLTFDDNTVVVYSLEEKRREASPCRCHAP